MLWQLPILTLLAVQASLSDVPPRYLPAAPEGGKIIARVNGVDVRAADLAPLLWDWRAQEALQDLTSSMLIRQEAERVGARVSDEEVEAQLQVQLKALEEELRGQAPLDQALVDQGFPRSRLYLRIQTQLLADKIVMRQFDPAEFVSVSTIVIRPESEQTSAIGLAIKRADEIYEKLQGGMDWSEAVAQFATNEAILKSNGYLGWRQLALFPQTVQKEMSELGPGGITRPVQTEHGIQIFRVDRIGKRATAEERAELQEAYLATARQALVQRLRTAAKIEKFLGQ